jgi:hypothetical protein
MKDLLLDELLKNHFYNALDQPPLAMCHFNQVLGKKFLQLYKF